MVPAAAIAQWTRKGGRFSHRVLQDEAHKPIPARDREDEHGAAGQNMLRVERGGRGVVSCCHQPCSGLRRLRRGARLTTRARGLGRAGTCAVGGLLKQYHASSRGAAVGSAE
jgi:hypothetical protein